MGSSLTIIALLWHHKHRHSETYWHDRARKEALEVFAMTAALEILHKVKGPHTAVVNEVVKVINET